MTALMFQILKMNVAAAVMISVAIGIGHFTKDRYSSKWKYCMWLIIMLFLLIPIDFSGKSLVKIQVGKTAEESSLTGNTKEPGVEKAVDPAEKINEAAANNSTSAGLQNKASQNDSLQHESNPGHSQVQTERKFSDSNIVSSSVIQLDYGALPLNHILNVMGIIWLCGIGFFGLVRGMRYYFSLHKMERWSYPADNEEMQELYFRICRKKHIKNPPRLLVWEGLTSPMLAGLWNPGLYVPEKAFSLEDLEFIFSHELSHYMRHDLWYKMLMLVVTTIHWFNPALYWMEREAEKDIENLCDGKMAAHYTMKDRMKYGELLLKIAASQNHIPYMSVGFSDGKRVFKDRILYMKNLRKLKEKVFPAVMLGVILVGTQAVVGVSFEAVQAGGLVEFQPDRNGENSVDMIAGSDFDENELARLENASEAAGHGQTNGNEAAELNIELEENQNGSTETNENSSSLDASGSGNSDLNGENENTDAADGNTDSNGGGSSDTESAQTRGITLTDDQKTVWATDGSWANYIYRATDGNWYDGSGRLYYENGGGSWTLASSGESATEDAPATPSEEAISSVNVTDDFGYNSQTLYETGSGEWMNNASGIYTDNGDGTFTGPDGTLWHEN